MRALVAPRLLLSAFRNAWSDVADALLRRERSERYYRSSNRVGATGLLVTVAITSIAAVVLGVGYGFATARGLPVSFGLVRALAGPVVYGGTLGVVTALVARAARIRDVRTTGLVALVAVLASYGVHWAAWASLVGPVIGDASSGDLAAGPSEVARIAHATLERGTFALFGVRGAVLAIGWVLEGVLVLASAPFLALYVATRRPYCERCGRWCSPPSPIVRLATGDFSGLRAALEARDFDRVADLPILVSGHAPVFVRLDAQICTGCRELCTLSARVVGRAFDEAGVQHDHEHVLVRWLLVTRDELNALARRTTVPLPLRPPSALELAAAAADARGRLSEGDPPVDGTHRWCAGLPSSGTRALSDDERDRLRHAGRRDASIGLGVLGATSCAVIGAMALLVIGGDVGVYLVGGALACFGSIALFPAGFVIAERLRRSSGLERDLATGEVERFEGRPRGAGLDETEERLLRVGILDPASDDHRVLDVLRHAGAVLAVDGRELSHPWVRATILEAGGGPASLDPGERSLTRAEREELDGRAAVARRSATTWTAVACIAAVPVAVAVAIGSVRFGWLVGLAALPLPFAAIGAWRYARSRRDAADLAHGRVRVIVGGDGRGGQITIERLAGSGRSWRYHDVPASWRVALDA
ncbi:MAG: hypothetical protein IT379_10785 [Deltaproteobacteria bacterium]|nr:hypothetical protein [Deltaproteobacteria bacterium]